MHRRGSQRLHRSIDSGLVHTNHNNRACKQWRNLDTKEVARRLTTPTGHFCTNSSNNTAANKKTASLSPHRLATRTALFSLFVFSICKNTTDCYKRVLLVATERVDRKNRSNVVERLQSSRFRSRSGDETTLPRQRHRRARPASRRGRHTRRRAKLQKYGRVSTWLPRLRHRRAPRLELSLSVPTTTNDDDDGRARKREREKETTRARSFSLERKKESDMFLVYLYLYLYIYLFSRVFFSFLFFAQKIVQIFRLLFSKTPNLFSLSLLSLSRSLSFVTRRREHARSREDKERERETTHAHRRTRTDARAQTQRERERERERERACSSSCSCCSSSLI